MDWTELKFIRDYIIKLINSNYRRGSGLAHSSRRLNYQRLAPNNVRFTEGTYIYLRITEVTSGDQDVFSSIYRRFRTIDSIISIIRHTTRTANPYSSCDLNNITNHITRILYTIRGLAHVHITHTTHTHTTFVFCQRKACIFTSLHTRTRIQRRFPWRRTERIFVESYSMSG